MTDEQDQLDQDRDPVRIAGFAAALSGRFGARAIDIARAQAALSGGETAVCASWRRIAAALED